VLLSSNLQVGANARFAPPADAHVSSDTVAIGNSEGHVRKASHRGSKQQ